MSQENVDNLRALLDDWDPKATVEAVYGGDVDAVDLFDPEVAYEDTVLPDHVGETYRGRDGLLRATERWLEPFESFTIKLERIVGTGDRLVSIQHASAKARHTGIPFEMSYAYLWEFRDGRVIYLKSYRDPAEALEAAGLRE